MEDDVEGMDDSEKGEEDGVVTGVTAAMAAMVTIALIGATAMSGMSATS